MLTAYEGAHPAPSGEPRLYDLRADPNETTDVARHHPTVVRDLLGRLQDVMAAPPPAPADPH